MQTIASITAIITLPLIAVFLFVLNRRTKFKQKIPRLKRGENGCAHISNKNLRVTALGDNQEYFLCQICNEKVKASELNN